MVHVSSISIPNTILQRIHVYHLFMSLSICSCSNIHLLRDNSDITCSGTDCIYNCQVKGACGAIDINDAPTIWCPQTGNSCSIYCETDDACTGLIIEGNRVENLSIFIMGNASNLYINKNYAAKFMEIRITNQATFNNSIINGGTTSAQDLTINCVQAQSCSNLNINTENMKGAMTFHCSAGITKCNDNEIICPHQQYTETTQRCHYICGDGNQCQNTIINARRGIDDINWNCGFNSDLKVPNICTKSVLQCGLNYQYNRNWQFQGDADIPWSLSPRDNSICYGGISSDPYCDNGIISRSFNGLRNVCCSSDCQDCYDGDQECINRIGGAPNCCTDVIRQVAASCNSNQAPCVITTSLDPTSSPTSSPS